MTDAPMPQPHPHLSERRERRPPAPIRMLVADIDGTLVGDDAARDEFRARWYGLDPALRPLLCYNSGRTRSATLRLVAEQRLPSPDYLISGVGTDIYDFAARRQIKAFSEIIDEGWDRARVAQVVAESPYQLRKQEAQHQNSFKSSWYFRQAEEEQLADLEQRLAEAGLDVNVVYSSGVHLDILPRWANKGNSVRWLLRRQGISPNETIVAGDSGNDVAMFLIAGIKGIIVGNAQPELWQATEGLDCYRADPSQKYAAAVTAGLIHYGVFPEEPLPDGEDGQYPEGLLAGAVELTDSGAVDMLTDAQLALIRQGYDAALVALRKNITPLGFSAASLEDNEVFGTSENYRSVWARDGAITICGTIPLIGHDDIRTCQKQTLETLLKHMSPNGHIPANVRIDDELPEYGGVGGIAAVDAPLWVIIAFYEYVRATHDMAFLRENIAALQRAMDWLSAHDSNNDALLEIPEAGDWTDLFGRSYNVLYDEVLWYRTNICFGRMLEMLGETERAGDYLRWSQMIKQSILYHFWPSTTGESFQTISFAEQQYSLGDARYLISQVTPFDFSWRCDTLGNVLAFLYNVIDEAKASRAFRFMWGVGVNEPYPIANLYPVVTAGAADWKEYYAVNLLNLPHHYHNGGIWPFVGGAWVRFIHKLGLHDVALNELYKLAQLNQLGVVHEWEFNEWAHGETGRPMGMAYQAWSASEYVYACHELGMVS